MRVEVRDIIELISEKNILELHARTPRTDELLLRFKLTVMLCGICITESLLHVGTELSIFQCLTIRSIPDDLGSTGE